VPVVAESWTYAGRGALVRLDPRDPDCHWWIDPATGLWTWIDPDPARDRAWRREVALVANRLGPASTTTRANPWE